MRIGIDAMGGDFAPLEAVKGCIAAKKMFPHIQYPLECHSIDKMHFSLFLSQHIDGILDWWGNKSCHEKY